MALFAELIVLFDLRLFQDAQGNEVFGQGFLREQSLPHNLERRRKLKKKERLSGRQEGELCIGLYRTERPYPVNNDPEQWGGSASHLSLFLSGWLANEGKIIHLITLLIYHVSIIYFQRRVP